MALYLQLNTQKSTTSLYLWLKLRKVLLMAKHDVCDILCVLWLSGPLCTLICYLEVMTVGGALGGLEVVLTDICSMLMSPSILPRWEKLDSIE